MLREALQKQVVVLPYLFGLVSLLLAAGCAREGAPDAAMAFSDGGGYDKTFKGTGAPEEIVFRGRTILAKARGGTHCSGFTFAVAMRVAATRGLLAGKSVEQVQRFQREWYGATPESREKQCVVAAQTLGVGGEVKLADARPGDFVQLWRASGTGHSVVLVRLLRHDGKLVGIEYRSSQGSTSGIGNRSELFTDADAKGAVLRARTYVCRLNSS
jgi:hypothetical protein